MTITQEQSLNAGFKIWPNDSLPGAKVTTVRNRVAIYLRISDDREGLELGVTRQENADLEAAIRAGATEVRRYCDNDISASSRSKKKRPDFIKLLADVRAGLIDTIVYYSNSRLTRRPWEYEEIIRLVEETGVRLISIVSGHIDLTTADGRMLGRILAAADAAEPDRISERVTEKWKQRRQQGKHHGGAPVLGYLPPDPTQEIGYMTHIDQEAAEHLNKGADIALTAGLMAVMHYWNKEGFLRLNGTPWRTRDEVRETLLAPRRAGLVAHDGKIMGVGDWPTIISAEKWERLNTKFSIKSTRSKEETARKYPCTGLVRCGECGSALRVKKKGTKRVDQWVCQKSIGGCGGIARAKPWVDAMISAYVEQRIHAEFNSVPVPADTAEKERIEKEISEKEDRVIKARTAAKDGRMDMDDAGEIMAELRGEINELRSQQAALLTAETQISTSRDDVIATWRSTEPHTVEARAIIARRYIARVIVHRLPRQGRWDSRNYPVDSLTITGR
ncbi:recombinase family protein [Streptosporangium canum]